MQLQNFDKWDNLKHSSCSESWPNRVDTQLDQWCRQQVHNASRPPQSYHNLRIRCSFSILIALGICKAIILASRAPQPDLLNAARTNITQFRRNNELARKQRRETERQLHSEQIASRQPDNTFSPIICAPIAHRTTGVQTDQPKNWGEKLTRLNQENQARSALYKENLARLREQIENDASSDIELGPIECVAFLPKAGFHSTSFHW